MEIKNHWSFTSIDSRERRRLWNTEKVEHGLNTKSVPQVTVYSQRCNFNWAHWDKTQKIFTRSFKMILLGTVQVCYKIVFSCLFQIGHTHKYKYCAVLHTACCAACLSFLHRRKDLCLSLEEKKHEIIQYFTGTNQAGRD